MLKLSDGSSLLGFRRKKSDGSTDTLKGESSEENDQRGEGKSHEATKNSMRSDRKHSMLNHKSPDHTVARTEQQKIPDNVQKEPILEERDSVSGNSVPYYAGSYSGRLLGQRKVTQPPGVKLQYLTDRVAGEVSRVSSEGQLTRTLAMLGPNGLQAPVNTDPSGLQRSKTFSELTFSRLGLQDPKPLQGQFWSISQASKIQRAVSPKETSAPGQNVLESFVQSPIANTIFDSSGESFYRNHEAGSRIIGPPLYNIAAGGFHPKKYTAGSTGSYSFNRAIFKYPNEICRN